MSSSFSSSKSSGSSSIEEDISEEDLDTFFDQQDITTNDVDLPLTNDVDLPLTNDVDTQPSSSSATAAVVTPTECAPVCECLTDNEAMRRFVLDRMIDDNVIDLELFFTDEEINHARCLAVANWNEIPPYVAKITLTTCDDCLPYPMVFVNGISYYLYLSKLQKLQKEDLDYNAGGMQVDLNKRRIKHLSDNIKIFKEEFIQLAMARKTHINYQGAWGQVG